MAFFEERLSVKLSYGARGGPQFSTTVVKAKSGFRKANKDWVMPLHVYDVSQCIRSNADFEELRAFFYNVAGQGDGFRFKDWGDYQCDRTNSSLTLISGSNYQLNRIYARGARTFTRPIYKPVSATVIVYDVGGTPLAATVDYTTGIATVTGTPAAWLGEFDVPVAFTSDVMEAEITSRSQGVGLLISWPSVQVEEIRDLT